MYIYTLSSSSNPDNIRYVGKANNLKDRLRRHISKYCLDREHTYKSNWIKSELDIGNKIIISEIEYIADGNWEECEIYWIEQFKQWGFKLTNHTIGGDGLRLTQDSIKKRNNTKIENNKVKKAELIKKYNIYQINEHLWQGNRVCPICSNSITHSSKSFNGIITLLLKSENRNCHSCTRFICNKDKGNKDFGKYGRSRSKPIIQYDINGTKITEFNSITEASKKLNINKKSIINCLKCIKWYKTAGGYIFKYKETQ